MDTNTEWQHNVAVGKIVLPQLQHLEKCIKSCGGSATLIEPFDLWQPYQNSSHGSLGLYAHDKWMHIRDLVYKIDQQTYSWVYMAINRYLLICDADASAPDCYDLAIKKFFEQHLQNYTVVDYQYQQSNHCGNVGNFVSPDNRILCKKIA